MKKFFLIVALVLAVVSSLVAGTMAAYTQTVDLTASSIVSKAFSVTNGTSNNFSTAIKLAPGDDVTYSVTLTNAGEVGTTVKVAALLSAASGKTANERLGMTYSVDGGTNWTTTAPADFTLAVGANKTIQFKIAWPYATDEATNTLDNAVMGSAFGSVFSVKFSCTSVNAGVHN